MDEFVAKVVHAMNTGEDQAQKRPNIRRRRRLAANRRPAAEHMSARKQQVAEHLLGPTPSDLTPRRQWLQGETGQTLAHEAAWRRLPSGNGILPSGTWYPDEARPVETP